MTRNVPRMLVLGMPLLGLAACSHSAPREAREAPAAASPAPKREAESAADSEKEPGGAHDFSAEDDRDTEAEKKAEPSLAEPPTDLPAEEWSSGEPSLEDVKKEESSFNQAMDPSALSCSGALPLRDAICSLADRICTLPPSSSGSLGTAKTDCEKARASCQKAKQSYAGRCGG